MSTKTKSRKKTNPDHDVLNALIIDSIQDIKGKKISKLDLRHLHDAPANYFIICEGDSVVQVKSIADHVFRNLKTTANELPSSFEGATSANWVCLDYFDTIVHIFHRDARKFYQLDELWSDARLTEYEDL